MWFNWKHLRVAEKYSSKTRENAVVLYFKHMWVGFREAGKQLILAILVYYTQYFHHYLILNY